MAVIRTPEGNVFEAMVSGMPVFGGLALDVDAREQQGPPTGEERVALAMTVARTATHYEGKVELVSPNPNNQAA